MTPTSSPSTVHADTQGQNFPVFALATLFGFDLMPRIRNFKDLIFFRASEKIAYPHIDQLFGESGRNVIDWKLIDKHWIDLMQVAISISEGRPSSATLMRRLRSNSRKNRIYKTFREVGRSVRTVALLRYLADPALRARVTAATNKVESYNGFSKWLGFGGVLADNDPEEQEKLIKFNTLLANLVVFHNALDISDVVRQPVALDEQDRGAWDTGLIAEGHRLVRERLAAAAAGAAPGRYQILAAINAVHTSARDIRDTDWSQVLVLYDQLVRLDPSPIIALNRAIAVAELDGPEVALAIVARLAEALAGYHAYHATRADLLRWQGHSQQSRAAYDRAIELAGNTGETAYLTRRRAQLQ
ncbi:Tn3 family transposase [Streptosporangium canum]|uniref:Tn3 family transposase n=1 Tax=Streptosporangium canum TaxID=324952 RepID=UPI00367D2C49